MPAVISERIIGRIVGDIAGGITSTISEGNPAERNLKSWMTFLKNRQKMRIFKAALK